jgi:hypothetical protein
MPSLLLGVRFFCIHFFAPSKVDEASIVEVESIGELGEAVAPYISSTPWYCLRSLHDLALLQGQSERELPEKLSNDCSFRVISSHFLSFDF